MELSSRDKKWFEQQQEIFKIMQDYPTRFEIAGVWYGEAVLRDLHNGDYINVKPETCRIKSEGNITEDDLILILKVQKILNR